MTSPEEASPGRRLELAIRAALVGLQGTSMAELARQSGVSRQTLYMWFSGMQEPSTNAMTKVARTLDVRVSDLWDAYQGREVLPTSTEESLRDLIVEMRENAELTRELLSRIDAIASGAVVAGVARAMAEAGGGQSRKPSPLPPDRTPAPKESAP